jgi:hypothetical protein
VTTRMRFCLCALVCCLLFAAAPLHAEDDASPGEAEQALRAELEVEYRRALESRLAHERETYAASLKSLWVANVAVWAILLAFIAYQAVSWRKTLRELERIKAELKEDT